MLKRKNTENVSEDAKKKPSLDTAGQSSSVDTESEHLFNVSESTVARTEAVNGSPTLDTYDIDTTDTLTLARTYRETQGPWEAEYSYGGEADLHQHYDNCTKNPGHKNFIPVDRFSIDDLPEGYRDPDIVDCIRAQSDLTVRVKVRYVSDGRPKTVPGSDKPYPCYANSGQNLMTVGTGWIHDVDICSHDQELECRCKDCGNSSTPKTPFAIIYIATAMHVVFDDTEAEHTTCHLFFDNGGTPDTCSGVIKLTGMSCQYTNKATDRCYLKHYTHDLELANRLKQAREEWRNLKTTLPIKLKLSSYRRRPICPDKQPLLFIVSHPHGCSKQISIGRYTSVKPWSEVSSCQYTTATCPGSSGAYVDVSHDYSRVVNESGWFLTTGNHGGASDELQGINYCYMEISSYWARDEIVSMDVWPLCGGSWDHNLNCVDEEDLHKRADTCQKNPARLNVYPVDKFSMDNLPPLHRNNETMEAIKSVSDLTVQVSVTCVSEERPKTVPDTDIPYPWYKTRGLTKKNLMRVGSARISTIDIPSRDYFSTPRCRACFRNLPEKPDGAYIYVRSSSRLIYDRKEAEHTTCRLFLDSRETPDLCNDEVTFTDMVHYCNYGIDDECIMVYVINDLTLAERLEDMTIRFRAGVFSLRELLFRTDSEIETKKRSSDPYIPAYVMVSHPHGSGKQITVLYAGNHDYVDANENQSHHVSITCPGSVGAPVIGLRRETFYTYCD